MSPLLAELDTVAQVQIHFGRGVSGTEGVNRSRSAWSVKEGNEARESLTSAGAHGQNTLTILRFV